MAARRRWALAFVPAILVACLALVDASAEPYSLPGDPLWPTREQIQKLDVAVQGRVSRCVPHRARKNACTPKRAPHFSLSQMQHCMSCSDPSTVPRVTSPTARSSAPPAMTPRPGTDR